MTDRDEFPPCYRCQKQPCECKDGITLYHADCLDVLPLLEPGSVDLVLTDPPYGIDHPTNYKARGRSNLAVCKDYPPCYGDAETFDPSFILALDKPTVLWGANHYASRLPDVSGWVVVDKERPDNLDQATCELAWTNFVKGARRFRWLWHGMLRASKSEPLEHPMQKPLALIHWVLGLRWTPPGTVLDLYAGSGTTGRACKDLGRKCILIEIEEKYCEIAARRLEQEVLFT